MDRNEKLLLSAGEEYGCGFCHGVFLRLYEQSLFWFSIHIKPLKPMLERVKGGEPVVYGGLPVASFEALLAAGGLSATEQTAYGYLWPYAAQSVQNCAMSYQEWREQALATLKTEPLPVKAPGTLVDGIMAFNLASSTPLEAMQAIHHWQQELRRQKGAG